MATVDALKNKKDIDLMKVYLKEKNIRYYLLFVIGLNSGLRIGDILRLKLCDLMSSKGVINKYLVIEEEKTSKVRKIAVNVAIQKALKLFASHYNPGADDYLFKSRKGSNRAISTTQAYRALTEAAAACKVDVNFGCHSLRKAWGYWTYKATGNNLGLVMDMLNHSSPAITLRYIGITQEQKDDTYMMVEI